MPTYQYRCTACSEPLEVVQSFTDAPLTGCPTCGGVLRKVFSAVGVVFKGSGFYQTDSRPAPKKDAVAKDGRSSKEAATATPAAEGTAKTDGAAKPVEKKSEQPRKEEPTGSGSHKVA